VRIQDREASSLMTLNRPEIDWVEISLGMGVPASLVDTVEELVTALKRAFVEPGPNLI